MNHLIRLKCYINDIVPCTLKEIWVWIQYITSDAEVRQCDESDEEVWWDVFISYWYNEDYT